MPRCGAISAAPETGTISTGKSRSAKKRSVRRGKVVATRAPAGGLDAPNWHALDRVLASVTTQKGMEWI
jgi:hypothetical protein